MQILIFILLAGKLLTVTAPQSIAAPEQEGLLAQMPNGQTTLVYAHSNLSGTLFYDLKVGDTITAYYGDGTTKTFKVVTTGIHIAQSTEIAKGGGNFDLRVENNWMKLTDVTNMYSTPNGITLITCYSANKGHAVTTGRLFLELIPVESAVNESASIGIVPTMMRVRH